MLILDNGILTRAEEAKKKTNYNSIKEEISFAFLESCDLNESQKLEEIEQKLKNQDANVKICKNGICIEIEYKSNKYLAIPMEQS